MSGEGELEPSCRRLQGTFGYGLTVDVEEWFHTCWRPDYVDPARRPDLAEELDRTLPAVLDLLQRCDCKATFFVLGEVAERHPARVREIASEGHEIASHGWLHLRALGRPDRELAEDLGKSRLFLEDLTGHEVLGFRAPEWSLRSWRNPQLRLVAEAGYRYDASLAPFSGAGRRSNPLWPCLLAGPSGGDAGSGERWELCEFPPLTFGGVLRLPAGSWTGRLARPERIARAADRARDLGGFPVLTVHPWEIAGAGPRGRLSGPARWIQEVGRSGFEGRLGELLEARSWGRIDAQLKRTSC